MCVCVLAYIEVRSSMQHFCVCVRIDFQVAVAEFTRVHSVRVVCFPESCSPECWFEGSCSRRPVSRVCLSLHDVEESSLGHPRCASSPTSWTTCMDAHACSTSTACLRTNVGQPLNKVQDRDALANRKNCARYRHHMHVLRQVSTFECAYSVCTEK